nr:hypothetical protein Iba_chr15dCG2950 [Ipomoea batatas]
MGMMEDEDREVGPLGSLHPSPSATRTDLSFVALRFAVNQRPELRSSQPRQQQRN